MSDSHYPGHTRVLSEAGSLKSLDDEWSSVIKLQKLSGVVLTDEPEICSLCREGSSAKKKVFACRMCKIGVCNICLPPKHEVCASCAGFVQGPHVVYKEGVLSTEILGKVFSTSYVRFVGDSVLVFPVQPDPVAPAGTFELWFAVSLHVSKYIFVMPAPAEKEEQAGADCPEPGSMFYCALQTGKDKKIHYFIADSNHAAAIWTSAITRVVEARYKGDTLDARDEVVVEGYLKCLAGFPKSWKTCYFHLHKGGRLLYFKENPCSPTKCLRMLSLKGATCKSNAHRILVVGDGITCACFRPHPSEMDMWVPAIALAVEKAQLNLLKKTLVLTQDQLVGFAPLDIEHGMFAIGDIVETFGLSSVSHNGLRGKVVAGPDNGRFEIMLPSSEVIRFRAANLRYPDEGQDPLDVKSPVNQKHAFSPSARRLSLDNDDSSSRLRSPHGVSSPASKSHAPPPLNTVVADSLTLDTEHAGSPRVPTSTSAAAAATTTSTSSAATTTTVDTPKGSTPLSPKLTTTALGEKTGRFQKLSSRDSNPEVLDEFLTHLSGAGKFAAVVGVEIKSPPVVPVLSLPPIDPDQVLAALDSGLSLIQGNGKPAGAAVVASSDVIDPGYLEELTPRIQRLEIRNADLENEIALLRIQLASVPETQKQINELRAVVVAFTTTRPLASSFIPLPSGIPPLGTSFPLPPGAPPVGLPISSPPDVP